MTRARVALLHGFLGAPAAWDEVRAHLPPGGHVAAVGLPGHAGGPVARGWAANLAIVDEAIAAALGGVDVVIGYSLGARVALGLVADGRAPRAILVSVNAGLDDAARPARRASDAAWAARFRTEPLPAVLDAWEAQPLFATQARVPAAARATRRAWRGALVGEQLARSLEEMGLAAMPDYRPAVDAARVHLVVGAEDAKFGSLARALPAPVTTIADAGHDVPLEQPAALAAVLATLLRG